MDDTRLSTAGVCSNYLWKNKRNKKDERNNSTWELHTLPLHCACNIQWYTVTQVPWAIRPVPVQSFQNQTKQFRGKKIHHSLNTIKDNSHRYLTLHVYAKYFQLKWCIEIKWKRMFSLKDVKGCRRITWPFSLFSCIHFLAEIIRALLVLLQFDAAALDLQLVWETQPKLWTFNKITAPF